MAKKPFLQLDFSKLPKMSKEDWILLILADEKKVRPRECAALMNEIFFFVKEFAPSVEKGLGFKGTGSGPFSHDVVAAVDRLVYDDFIDVRRERGTDFMFYSLTEKGNVKANSLIKNLPEKEQMKIRFAQFIAKCMGYMGTLQYLGSVHPEYVYICTAGDTPV